MIIIFYETNNIVDLSYVKSLLDNENIKYIVTDEQISNILPHYNIATGGMKIKIDESDYCRASELLKNSKIEINTQNDLPDEVYIENSNNKKLCPKCKSEDITVIKRDAKPILSTLLSLIVMLPVPIRNKYFKCNICNSYWDKKNFSFLKLIFLGFILMLLFFCINKNT